MISTQAAARDVAEYRSAFLAFWRGRPDRSEAALADFFEDACGAVAKPARRGLSRRGLSRQLTGLAAKPTMSFDNFEVLLASLEETRVSKKFAERLFTEMATDAELDFDEFRSYLVGRGKFSAASCDRDEFSRAFDPGKLKQNRHRRTW